MPISEIRIQHFRAYSDTGALRINPLTPIVGKNDSGKSAILHALRLFFEPPKRGGIDISDLHCKDDSCNAVIEVAFKPSLLRNQEVKIDAKNKIQLVNDNLVDQVIQETHVPHLFLISSGTLVPNPSELLSGERTSYLISLTGSLTFTAGTIQLKKFFLTMNCWSIS